MAITATDQYRHPPRIDRQGFRNLLQQRANPAVLQERNSDEYYDECVHHGVDPLFVLAMFNRESSMGKEGVAVTSKSWGNTRAPNFGATPVGEMPGRTGVFPVWGSWLEGLRSTCARLVTQDWYYRFEQRNIGEVFIDPHWPNRNPDKPIMQPNPRTDPIEWAPAGDLNSPTGYLNAMLRFMNDHANMETELPVTWNPIIQGDNIKGVPFRVDILPETNVNRKRLPMNSYAGPLIHDTGNTNWGANAEMHRQFLRNGGGSESVAWHFTIDDKEIIQHLPLNEGAWHAGNTACNQSRWGMELCINSDGNFNKTMANAAKLVQFLWEYAPETNGKIGQHWDCSSKNCPASLRAGRWEEFLGLINAQIVRPPDPNAEMFILDGNAFWIVNTVTENGDDVRMLDFFREMGGVPRLGYPVGGMRLKMIGGKRVYTQETENVLMEAWMQDFGNMPAPYYRFGRRLPL